MRCHSVTFSLTFDLDSVRMFSVVIFETYFSNPNTYGLLQLIDATRGPRWRSGNTFVSYL